MPEHHRIATDVPSVYGLVLNALIMLLLPLTVSASPYSIEIIKSARQLMVLDGDQIVKTFSVAYGKGGQGKKQQMGDKKTPVGKYKVLEFKTGSRFFLFMQINYPNLLDAWHGYRNDLISSSDFKDIANAYATNTLPPQDTALGGYIGLHGIGEVTTEKLDIHSVHNWTDGCIALRNEEISELRNYITIGTEVVIRE